MRTDNLIPLIAGDITNVLHMYLPERGEGRSFFVRSDKGHIDLPRAREGGLAGGFFAIFVPAPSQDVDANANRMTVIQTENGYEVPYAPAIDAAYAKGVSIAM